MAVTVEEKSKDKPYVVTQWQQMTYIVRSPNGDKRTLAKNLQDPAKRVGLISVGKIHEAGSFVTEPREATLEELEEARPAKPELLVGSETS